MTENTGVPNPEESIETITDAVHGDLPAHWPEDRTYTALKLRNGDQVVAAADPELNGPGQLCLLDDDGGIERLSPDSEQLDKTTPEQDAFAAVKPADPSVLPTHFTDEHRPCPMIVLRDGHQIIPAADPELNAIGDFLIITDAGEYRAYVLDDE